MKKIILRSSTLRKIISTLRSLKGTLRKIKFHVSFLRYRFYNS